MLIHYMKSIEQLKYKRIPQETAYFHMWKQAYQACKAQLSRDRDKEKPASQGPHYWNSPLWFFVLCCNSKSRIIQNTYWVSV